VTAGVRYPGAVSPEWSPHRRGPNGRRLCARCLSELSGRRLRWCSQKCADAHMMLVSGRELRRAVEARDGGRCATCRRKRDRLRATIAKAIRRCDFRGFDPSRARCPDDCRAHRMLRAALARGLPADTCRSWWEADHIVPLSEGGVTTLDNIRTLCVACHKRETKALAGRLASGRKISKEAEA